MEHFSYRNSVCLIMASTSSINMQAFYYMKFSDRKKKKLKGKKNPLCLYKKCLGL